METKYMNDVEFVAFVKSLPVDYKRLKSIGGFNRWIIKGEDGVEYILRPESSNREATHFEVTKVNGETVKIRALTDEEIKEL